MAGVAMVPAQGKQGGDVDTVPDFTNVKRATDEDNAKLEDKVQKEYGGDRQKYIDWARNNGAAMRYDAQSQRWEGGDMVKLTHKVSVKSGDLRQQFAQLQIMDLISGQNDRHANNYFIAIVNGKPVLTAIDNDMAWGVDIKDGKGIKTNAGVGKSLGFPPAATQADINAVNGLTNADLRAMLKGFSEPEIKAAEGRLQGLKDHFNSLQPDQILTDWGSPKADQALAKYGKANNCYILRDGDYFNP
jgi:hypothetical protein